MSRHTEAAPDAPTCGVDWIEPTARALCAQLETPFWVSHGVAVPDEEPNLNT